MKLSFKKITLLLCIVFSLFLFVGCGENFNCDFFTDDDNGSGEVDESEDLVVKSNQLKTPILCIDRESKKLQWSQVEFASSYKLIKDGVVLDTIAATSADATNTNYTFDADTNLYEYDITASMNTDCQFALQAFTSVYGKLDSYKSPIVILTAEKPAMAITEYSVETGTAEKNPSITISEKSQTLITVTWNNILGSNYIVYYYTNSKGTTKVVNDGESNPITTSALQSTVDLTIDENKEIMVVKVASYEGTLDDDTVIYMSENNYYYNPESQTGYTGLDEIYLFDGLVNDHYITSKEQLNNLIYYHFIYRDETFELKLSDAYVANIEAAGETANKAIENAYDSFIETCDFDLGNEEEDKNLITRIGTSNCYEIAQNFYDINECDLNNMNLINSGNMNNMGIQLKSVEPYYDTYDFNGKTMIDENGFVSDKQFLTTEVSTSEQLYWAVENNITPIVVADSRADIIYQLAKEVLTEIIAEEMTDYEKALCIYDYITVNTVYDNRNCEEYRTNYGIKYTQWSSYYLEGIFLKELNPLNNNNIAVCDGFSKCFSLMCNMLGIETIRITGSAYSGTQSGLHAWNKVKVNGEYQLVDITWTELKNQAYFGDIQEQLTHQYFMVTDNFVATTHKPCAERIKFNKYTTPNSNQNYYQNVTINEHKNAANQSVSTADNKVDYLISDFPENSTQVDEFENLLLYVVYSNKSYVEILFDYNYLAKLVSHYNAEKNVTNYEWESALREAMKEYKIKATTLSYNYSNSYYYYTDQDYGVLMLIEFDLLIDAAGELEGSVENKGVVSQIKGYMTNNSITGTVSYSIMIGQKYLNTRSNNASEVQLLINAKILSLLLTNVTITYLDQYTTLTFSDSIVQAYICKIEITVV